MQVSLGIKHVGLDEQGYAAAHTTRTEALAQVQW